MEIKTLTYMHAYDLVFPLYLVTTMIVLMHITYYISIRIHVE